MLVKIALAFVSLWILLFVGLYSNASDIVIMPGDISSFDLLKTWVTREKKRKINIYKWSWIIKNTIKSISSVRNFPESLPKTGFH